MAKIWGYFIDHDMCNGFDLLSTSTASIIQALLQALGKRLHNAVPASHYANCHSLSGGVHDTLLLFSSCWIDFSRFIDPQRITLVLTTLNLYTLLVLLRLVRCYIGGTGVSVEIWVVLLLISYLILSFIHSFTHSFIHMQGLFYTGQSCHESRAYPRNMGCPVGEFIFERLTETREL